MATRNGDLHAQVQELTTDIAVLEERLKGEKTAKELQAEEYKRRLNELNQAHERAEKVLSTYITRELFDQTMKEFIDWRRVIDAQHTSSTARTASHTSIIAILFALASIATQLWNAFH